MSVLQTQVALSPIELSSIRSIFWRWFDQNQELVIFRKRILFLSIDVQVKQLEDLFEHLFGAKPATSLAGL